MKQTGNTSKHIIGKTGMLITVGIVAFLVIMAGATTMLITGNVASNNKLASDSESDKVKAQAVTVTYSDTGFSPQSITVTKGTTVNFINKSQIPLWVATDPHPEHTDYPEFESVKANDGKLPEMGQDFSFVFKETGTWKYHSHTASSDIGTEEVHPGSVTVE